MVKTKIMSKTDEKEELWSTDMEMVAAQFLLKPVKTSLVPWKMAQAVIWEDLKNQTQQHYNVQHKAKWRQ